MPPAWSDVWFCKDTEGHIQATGRDAKGRKQYIYHTEWRERQERSKFAQLAEFADALVNVRQRIERDLAGGALRQAVVLAAAAQLLDLTGIRVGNRSYFEQNGTVGLTTLQGRHLTIKGGRIELSFTAKSGKEVHLRVTDRRLARVLLRCEELPGQQLFCYREDGELRAVDSTLFNDYLRAASGADFTAKDFRIWIGTVTIIEKWLQDKRVLKIKEATGVASRRLANTAAVARRSYLHPEILAIVTTRPPAPEELRFARRDAAWLSGAERLCAKLLGDPRPACRDG